MKRINKKMIIPSNLSLFNNHAKSTRNLAHVVNILIDKINELNEEVQELNSKSYD